MAELLAIGQDLKNLTIVNTLNKDGSANLRFTGDPKYKPELRLTVSEVWALMSAWSVPTPIFLPPVSKQIVGVNGGVGWGPTDAKFLLEAGITGVRIEDGVISESAQTAIADKFIPAHCSVVVGNINDSTPLTDVNIPAWTIATVERIRALQALGFTRFEAGNEMYLKANAFDARTYANMCKALYEALDMAGIKVSVGISCVGDIIEHPASPEATWLRVLIAAQPMLAARADFWVAHPYPPESGKITDTGWHANCGPVSVKMMIETATALAVKNNVWSLTEFGVQLSGPAYATGSQEHQANMCKEYMTAFLAIPQVENVYYFSVHDTGEGTFGLVTTPSPAGPLPWEPRPVLSVVSSFALQS